MKKHPFCHNKLRTNHKALNTVLKVFWSKEA
jgi:hypothetical protein